MLCSNVLGIKKLSVGIAFGEQGVTTEKLHLKPKETKQLEIDVLIYTIAAGLMMLIYIGFLAWAIKTGQFKDSEELKYKPLEEEDEPCDQ